MGQKTIDIGPVSSKEAFDTAEHWRRFAHRRSVVFKDSKGQWFCVRYSRDAIKRAMLAMGTGGHLFVKGEGHPARVGWREACIRLRNVAIIQSN